MKMGGELWVFRGDDGFVFYLNFLVFALVSIPVLIAACSAIAKRDKESHHILHLIVSAFLTWIAIVFIFGMGLDRAWWWGSMIVAFLANLAKEIHDRIRYRDILRDSIKEIGLGMLGSVYTIISYWCLN